MNVGDAVRFAEPHGSWGLIEAVTHYDADTFYVRWYYGVDVKGRDITSLGANKRRELELLPRAAFNKYRKLPAFSEAQSKLRAETLRKLAKAALARHAQTIRAKRRRR